MNSIIIYWISFFFNYLEAMQNQNIVQLIENLKGRRSYEEKKAFNSLVVLVYNLDETTQKS